MIVYEGICKDLENLLTCCRFSLLCNNASITLPGRTFCLKKKQFFSSFYIFHMHTVSRVGTLGLKKLFLQMKLLLSDVC